MILRVVKWIANIRFAQAGLPAADFAFIIPQSDSCDKSKKRKQFSPLRGCGERTENVRFITLRNSQK